jgi:hypothetical protein
MVRQSTVNRMRAMGLAVAILPSKRPALRVVVLDDVAGPPQVVHCSEVLVAAEAVAGQLHFLARSVDSRARGVGNIDRVVVRRADTPPRATNAEGPKLRLLSEGAVIASVRDVVPAVDVGTGRDIGRWHSTNKDRVEAAARALLIAASEDERYVEAAAAALAGLAQGVV